MLDEVPEDVKETIDKHGIYVPDDLTDESRVFYQRALEGECMLCETDCGDTTCVILNDLGVVMMFCSQVCLQDFLNMHWMMQQYEDMVEAARFRNQQGNN